MSNERLQGIVIEPFAPPRIVEIGNTLEEYYKCLDCDMIEHVVWTIDGVEYDFICDEEALLKDENPHVSIKSKDNSELRLVNKILLCSSNEESGEFLSIPNIASVLDLVQKKTKLVMFSDGVMGNITYID